MDLDSDEERDDNVVPMSSDMSVAARKRKLAFSVHQLPDECGNKVPLLSRNVPHTIER